MVSIFKVHGAYQKNMFQYYALSGGLVFIISLATAILLSIVIYPWFNQLIGAEISLEILVKRNYIIPFLGIIAIVFLVVGLYPAWLFSKINPINLLQGKIASHMSLGAFSKILLVFQFSASIILIAGVITVFKQIDFMKNKNPGFEASYLLKQDLHYSINNPSQIKSYTNELLRNPNINKLTLSDGIPLWLSRYSSQEINNNKVDYLHIDCDTAFFNVFDINLLKGRHFLGSESSNVCIISEKLVKDCGYKDPLNKKIGNKRIIGVIEDIYCQSMHKKLSGVMIRPVDKNHYRNLTLQISGNDIPKTITYLEENWSQFFPEYPFNYQFYDDLIGLHYQKEQKLANSISTIAGLSVFLSCLGLLGLVINMVKSKIKEIGVRKVNGAKVSEIVLMLNKNLTIWVAISLIISCPIIYYIMNRWLESFAYKTELSWWVFATSGVIALIIALLTVSWQSWRAATKNPVEALRYE